MIDWLQEASLTAVSRQLGLSWDEVDGIQARAVARGLARRKLEPPRRIGVDERSFQKRHEYVTVVSDLDCGVVLHVADDHYDGSLDQYYESVGPEGVSRLEVVCMDMWRSYVFSTLRHVPDAGGFFPSYGCARDRTAANHRGKFFDAKRFAVRLICRIVMEPTGTYHRPLAHRPVAAGFEVWWVSSLPQPVSGTAVPLPDPSRSANLQKTGCTLEGFLDLT